MIRIECDNCEKPFEVDDAEAGGKVPCPECGDINRVPEAADAPRPGRSSSDVGGGEEELKVIRPAMMRAHPFRAAIIALLIIGGLGVAAWGAWIADDGAKWTWLKWPGLVGALVGAGWLGVWWIKSRLWIRVVITNKRTVRYEGIIQRHSTEVLHDHVRSVDIQQTFLQRILKVGYVGIDSAGQDGIEIEIRDMPGPYQIKKIIDQYRKL